MVVSAANLRQLLMKMGRLIMFRLIGFSFDFGLTFILRDHLSVSGAWANSIGFLSGGVIGMSLNVLSKMDAGDSLKSKLYTLFIGLILVNSILFLFEGQESIGFYSAKIIASAVVVSWNFGYNYQFDFRKSEE